MIYIHLRVSTDKQEKDGQGLVVQEREGLAIFKSQEVRVVKEVGSGRKES